ncbi:DUF3499 domain-containing protein [Serinibacter arcticus]|uniref:DUF3499 domain-containing protein n=1 Tax=Serinibacter arcticus TaxID=1655435 RepID=A0A2U1ZYW3_9MICO|nr:DUF3499 domain-containing protein [Serinibacter arcticus]PWD52130.1 DUF3499 domain-containing protein [Serinibacter arcticus]
MRPARQCIRPTCAQPAVATLTYVYADSTAVLGPLSTHAEPHSYDLCGAHAERLTVPHGWEVVRLDVDLTPAAPTSDDLVALADAVREASRTVPRRATPPAQGRPVLPEPPVSAEPKRRGHLRVLDGGE